MITQPDGHVVHPVLDEMLQYVTEDGINMVKFICHYLHSTRLMQSAYQPQPPDRPTLILSAHAQTP